MSKIAAIIGRVLIAILFIASGISKLVDIGPTQLMLARVGLPPELAIPTALFELIGGLCLAAGFMVRLVAVLLAVFTAATILFFHNRFTDPVEAVALLKNLAIIGGLSLAFAHSWMWSHYYAIRSQREEVEAGRRAEQRAHEAELRAVRAEAAVAAQQSAAPHTTAASAPVYVDRDGDGVPDSRVAPAHRRWFDW